MSFTDKRETLDIWSAAFRSSCRLSPYSSSAASSTRNLSSFVIESAVGESGGDGNLPVEVRTLENPVVTQPTSRAKGEMHSSHRVTPPSSGHYRAISPHIPCSPPTQARAPFMKLVLIFLTVSHFLHEISFQRPESNVQFSATISRFNRNPSATAAEL